MVLLFDVVIDLYIVVTVGFCFRNTFTSLYLRLLPKKDLCTLTNSTVYHELIDDDLSLSCLFAGAILSKV